MIVISLQISIVIETNKPPIKSFYAFQVYLVTGLVKTTEILKEGASKWKFVGPLPAALSGSKIISVENRIILTGKPIDFLTILNQLCSFIVASS